MIRGLRNLNALVRLTAPGALLFCLVAGTAAQQVLQNQRATVEVHVIPERVITGEKVTIRELTDFDAGTPIVRIAITSTPNQNSVMISEGARIWGFSFP